MRADRLLTILLLLQSRSRMTAADLAERLEVCERTIYRDLDALSAAGVPVYADRGPGGGCALRRGYRTDLTGLNAGEVASLFAGTAGRQLQDLGLGAGFQGALAKLEAALPAERRAEAEQARARIHVDATPWFTPRESARHLPALREAVLGDRIVRLGYRGADGRAVTRRTQPLGIVVKGGIWYLAGLTSGQMRVYRVSRLHKVATTKERFERPKNFDLAAFWGRWSAELVGGIPQYHFKVRLARSDAPVLAQVFGERVRPAVDAARKRARGRSLVVELSFDTLQAACGAVLGLGTLVEVIEPEELRQAVGERAAAVARRYGKGA